MEFAVQEFQIHMNVTVIIYISDYALEEFTMQ